MTLPHVTQTDRPLQIGLIVLAADETLERDMRALLPEPLEYLVTRIPSGTSVTPETLAAMAGGLTAAASLFPQGAVLSAVGYGCTSAAAELGADRIAALIHAGTQTPHVTEPVSALIAACQHLGVRRIGLISPYIASVSGKLRAVLAEAGIEVTGFATFDEPVEAKVVRIAASSIADAAFEMGQNPACEAIFVSCTNLRTLDVIAPTEARIGKPVLSSNQVLAWHVARLAAPNAAPHGPGALFADQT